MPAPFCRANPDGREKTASHTQLSYNGGKMVPNFSPSPPARRLSSSDLSLTHSYATHDITNAPILILLSLSSLPCTQSAGNHETRVLCSRFSRPAIEGDPRIKRENCRSVGEEEVLMSLSCHTREGERMDGLRERLEERGWSGYQSVTGLSSFELPMTEDPGLGEQIKLKCK